MYRENSTNNAYLNLLNYIEEFNKNNQILLSIDSIRITFNKQHKLDKILNLGRCKKIDKSSKQIKQKLKKRLSIDEVTSAYQLENHNIYFYNSKKDKPKYRSATMVIFGMKQYHKKPLPHHLVEKIVNMLTYKTSKNEDVNIDLCCDLNSNPNIEKLKEFFKLTQHILDNGKLTDTYYINQTDILMLNKVCIYNKALKNKLQGILYRIEANIQIPNIKALYMPLNEFKHIIQIARGK